MDRMTFELLAPPGSRIVQWGEVQDDCEVFSAVIRGELMVATNPVTLLCQPSVRHYLTPQAQPQLALVA